MRFITYICSRKYVLQLFILAQFLHRWHTCRHLCQAKHYGEPHPIHDMLCSRLLCNTLLYFEAALLSICFAVSRFLLIYSAKSLEFIGDFLNSKIFRIVRSIACLWNWFKYVIAHFFFFAKINYFHETSKLLCPKHISLPYFEFVYAELMEQKEQSQVYLSYAASWQKKTKSTLGSRSWLVWGYVITKEPSLFYFGGELLVILFTVIVRVKLHHRITVMFH